MVQFLSGPQAAELIPDGATIALLGNGGATVEPRLVYRCIGERFEATGAPRDLTVIHSAGIGDRGREGLSRFAQDGMTKRVIGGFWSWSPAIQQMANEGRIEAYNLPQGCIVQNYREIAAKRPGLITRIGTGTFVDPRNGGGKLNDRTTEDLVDLVEIDGRQWLRYQPWQVDVGIIRGTTADVDGNITFEHEVAWLEAQAIAQAAHNCGGIVIAQVHFLAERGSLNPQLVKVPGMLVDVVVVDPDQWQTCQSHYDPALSGALRRPVEAFEPMPLGHRKVVARRAAQFIEPGMIINLGYGMPDGVARVAHEEQLMGKLTATIEQGIVGGIPAPGDIFGAAWNAEAFVDAPAQFDFYSGGGLDIAFLGLAQADAAGNVNVSKFGPTIAGCGGFIDISQSSKAVVFCGTFTLGGLITEVGDGVLKIVREGRARKFLAAVEQITFSGDFARAEGQPVWFVTERAVFKLAADGLELVEIAPGIDLQTQVLDLMDFTPRIATDLKIMNAAIFRDQPLGLNHEGAQQ